MDDDELMNQLRRAEAPVTPDPRFADRLYLELAGELELPTAQDHGPSAAVGAVRSRRVRTRRRLTLLAAAMLLLVLGLLASIAGGQLLERSTTSPGWPMFKGDAARRAEGADGPIGQPVLRWRYQANGAVPDNVAVVGDLAYASSDDGVLHALDVLTGVERWSFDSDTPTLSGPVVLDGAVYVFDGSGVLNALDAATGVPRWRSTDPVAGASSPTVGDGVLYSGADDGSLVAIDAADGTERWRVSISTTGGLHAPAYAGGRVYVAEEGGGYVAVDAADGSLVWRFDTGDDTATAVVADGIAYVGSSWLGAGMLWALDAETGMELWRIEQPLFTPAVAGGVAYSGSAELGVFAIDAATGRQLWRFPVKGTARPLAVADGLVFVPADQEQRIYALDAATGAEVWHFDVDSRIDCCIAVGKGAVYVGTQFGGVYAIGGGDDPSAAKD